MATQKAIPLKKAAPMSPQASPPANPSKAPSKKTPEPVRAVVSEKITAPPRTRVRKEGGTPARTPLQAKAPVSPDLRQRMIQDAAYYLAEQNGFEGDPDRHWLEAEAQIDRFLQEDRPES